MPTLVIFFFNLKIKFKLKLKCFVLGTDNFMSRHWDYANTADFVFLEYPVYFENLVHEFVSFWRVLRPGGVLMGRNFNFHHEGIMAAVLHASQTQAMTPHLTADGCWLEKKKYNVFKNRIQKK